MRSRALRAPYTPTFKRAHLPLNSEAPAKKALVVRSVKPIITHRLINEVLQSNAVAEAAQMARHLALASGSAVAKPAKLVLQPYDLSLLCLEPSTSAVV